MVWRMETMIDFIVSKVATVRSVISQMAVLDALALTIITVLAGYAVFSAVLAILT